VIEECYRRFLLENHDPEDREYPDDHDQIREILVHENYLSVEDVKLCSGFNLAKISAHADLNAIRVLRQSLCNAYAEETV
jgi:hypothetical protein